MADGVFVLITTLVGIICFLIDVVLNSGNDRHDPTTLSSTFDLTYMPMTYVRGTILQYLNSASVSIYYCRSRICLPFASSSNKVLRLLQ